MSKSSTAQIQPLRAIAITNSAFGASDYNFRIMYQSTFSEASKQIYTFGQLCIRTTILSQDIQEKNRPDCCAN